MNFKCGDIVKHVFPDKSVLKLQVTNDKPHSSSCFSAIVVKSCSYALIWNNGYFSNSWNIGAFTKDGNNYKNKLFNLKK